MALLETQSGLAGQYGYANGAPILNASVARDLLGNELSKSLDIERNELGWGTNSKYLGKIYTGAGLYGIDMPRAELDQLLSVGDQAKRDFAAGKIQQMVDTDTNQIYYTETDPDKGFGNSVQRFATDETNAFENFNKWVDATNKLSNAAQSLGIDTRGMTDRQILDAVNARDTRIAVTGRTQFWDANQAGIGGTEGPQHATVVYTQQNGKLVPVASPKTFEFQDPNTNKGFFGDLFENIIDVISIPPIAAALGAYAFGPGGLLSSAGEAAASAAGGGAAELASVGATGYGLTGPIVATPGLLETIQNVSNVIPTPGTSVSAPATQIVTPIAPSVIPTAAEIAAQAEALGIGAGVGPGIAPAASVVPTAASAANVFEYGFPEPQTPFVPAPAEVVPGYATPENVFEYGFPEPQTPFTPVPVDVIPASNIKPTDVLRAANTLQQLTQQPQQQAPQTPEQTGQSGPLGVDYSQLLNLLANQARTTGLLGTRFQPTPVNLSSLLG
jgi:hypothetical protein